MSLPSSVEHPHLLVVNAAADARLWRQWLEVELRRLGYLADSPVSAHALAVVIGPDFIAESRRAGDPCVALLREALNIGKPLLPVTVEATRMPQRSLLPRGIEGLTTVQALYLDSKSDVPATVARLIAATRNLTVSPPMRTGDRAVFMSYRRDDAWYWASLLARALAIRLDPGNVFFDLGSLAPGARFHPSIQRATDFVIVVGPTFLAVDSTGKRRIKAAEDYVRLEIREALAQRKAVHIVLAGGATLPDCQTLPPDVAPAFQYAQPLTLADFRSADTVAETIIGTARATVGPAIRIPQLRSLGPPGRMTTESERRAHALASSVHGLVLLGWLPPLDKKGIALVLHRRDCQTFRFRLDPDRCEVYLEELGRNIYGLGLKRWIKRALFAMTWAVNNQHPSANDPTLEQV